MKLRKMIAVLLINAILGSTLLMSSEFALGAEPISPDGLFDSAESEAIAYAKQDLSYIRTVYTGNSELASFDEAREVEVDPFASAAIFGFDGDYDSSEWEISEVPLRKNGHKNYLNGSSSGRFDPEAGMTRAEAAQMLFNLLENQVVIEKGYSDVSESAWYYRAVSTLATLGVIGGTGLEFKPDKLITRAEFVAMLCHFEAVNSGISLSFPDLSSSHWAYGYIRAAAGMGWITGFEDGSVGPDSGLSRAQTTALMNRFLNRYPDRNCIDSNPDMRLFADDIKNHWAYYDIMEATVSHNENKSGAAEFWSNYDHLRFSGTSGHYYIGNHLYYCDGDMGRFVTDTTVGGFQFDANGHYTCGSYELDAYLLDVANSVFTSDMSRDQMLRAAFLYVRDSFSYLRRAAYDFGATGWETADALTMFETRYGNCYSYAAAFYHLARWLGYDACTYAGTVGSNYAPHGWVEISFGDIPYIFDTELEMARLRDGKAYFSLYWISHQQAPWIYNHA